MHLAGNVQLNQLNVVPQYIVYEVTFTKQLASNTEPRTYACYFHHSTRSESHALSKVTSPTIPAIRYWKPSGIDASVVLIKPRLSQVVCTLLIALAHHFLECCRHAARMARTSSILVSFQFHAQ